VGRTDEDEAWPEGRFGALLFSCGASFGLDSTRGGSEGKRNSGSGTLTYSLSKAPRLFGATPSPFFTPTFSCKPGFL
jgi:hypothetical protein